MSININYTKKNISKTSANIVLFSNEKFNIVSLKKYLSNSEFSYISDLLKKSDLKKDLLLFEISSKKSIYLVSIKKDIKISEIESLGAKFYSYINFERKNDYYINSDTLNTKINSFLGHFFHGLKLKSYEFNLYKSSKKKKLISVYTNGSKNKVSKVDQIKFKALEDGSFFARDLVSEPGNILHPDE